MLESTGQAIGSELFTGNSACLLPRAVVTGARDVPARDRSRLSSNHMLEINGQVIDSELFTGSSARLLPCAVVTAARDRQQGGFPLKHVLQSGVTGQKRPAGPMNSE